MCIARSLSKDGIIISSRSSVPALDECLEFGGPFASIAALTPGFSK